MPPEAASSVSPLFFTAFKVIISVCFIITELLELEFWFIPFGILQYCQSPASNLNFYCLLSILDYQQVLSYNNF